MKPRPGTPVQPKQKSMQMPQQPQKQRQAGIYETSTIYSIKKKPSHKPRPEQFHQSLFDALTHELRSPVTSICGAAEQLIGRTANVSDPVLKELISVIFESSRRLDRTIGDLLESGRISSGAFSLKPDWCDISDIFSEIRYHTLQSADLKRVIFTATEKFPLLLIDQRLITRALANILDNALRNAPQETFVTISARTTRTPLAVITIDDEGHGFTRALLRNPLRRFTSERSAAYAGTGLGISIAREFVEAHGGSLHLSNRSGGGARVTIKLALNADEKKSKEAR